MLNLIQKREIGRRSWPRSALNIPYIGRFHEETARSMWTEDVPSPSPSDLCIADPSSGTQVLLEVKSCGDSHGGVRAPLEQFTQMADLIGFEIGRGAYVVFAWKSRQWVTETQSNFSVLSRCRDVMDMWAVLIRNTTHVYILDTEVMSRLGREDGKLVNPKESCVFVKHTTLRGLIKSPAKTMKSLGLKPRKWNIASAKAELSFNTDALNLGLYQTMSLQVTEIHDANSTPLVSLMRPTPSILDLSGSMMRG